MQQTFASPSRPALSLPYSLVGSEGVVLLWLYGIGGSSSFLALLHDYTVEEKLRVLCIDRWVEGDPLESAATMVDDWLALTTELLDHLAIDVVYPVAHSFGALLALELARHLGRERVPRLFLVSPATPAPVTGSPVLLRMAEGPLLFFRIGRWLETTDWSSVLPFFNPLREAPGPLFIGSPAAYEEYASRRVRTSEEMRRVEMAIVFGRHPGRSMADLVQLFADCRTPIVWYTSDKDTFYHAEVADKVRALRPDRPLEVVQVEGAMHYNIDRRKEVWEDVARRVRGLV